MFEEYKYHRKLKKLQKTRDKIRSNFGAYAKEDSKANYYSQLLTIDDDIDLLKTRYMLTTANRLSLPLPEPHQVEFGPSGEKVIKPSGDWKPIEDPNHIVLTTKGYNLLRDRIRQEKRARREDILAWGPFMTGLIAALTGLGGVIVALYALSKSSTP